MKTIIGSFLLFLMFPLISFSQSVSFDVEEIKENISKGEANGFAVYIPQAHRKDVEKAWSKDIRVDTKSKVVEKDGEFFIEGTNIDRLSANPINVFSRIIEMDSGVKVHAFFEVDSTFLSSEIDEEKATVAKKIVAEFASDAYTFAVQEELEEEEKKLKNLNNDLKKLVNENEKMHKTIAMNNSDIDALNADLDQNKLKLDPNHGKTVAVYDENGREIDRAPAPSEVKKIDADLKKEIDKEAKKIHKKIFKLESEIREAERNIPVNLQEQEEKKSEIEAQEMVIEKVMQKLENVQ
ncbi:hypothetical protein [Flexithrix dorotheae]|uniref:hypothetical protein n=1 Tax=Flexithrix dorotheae TaxID=70993 RepID=UPI0003A81A18|nr:hypothetical protein [Flexithrix dorotheae]